MQIGPLLLFNLYKQTKEDFKISINLRLDFDMFWRFKNLKTYFLQHIPFVWLRLWPIDRNSNSMYV